MDIPTAVKVLEAERDTASHQDDPAFYEALGVALQCFRTFHIGKQRAVISQDPDLAKAISQDINVLNQLAFATALDQNADLKSAAEHGAAALNRMIELAVSSTHQAALNRLYL